MAIPAIPQNFYIQQGNSQVFLSWDIAVGATSYSVQRSTDGVTFSALGTPAVNNYLDTTVTVGTNYYYQIASVNASGTSSYCASQNIVPTKAGMLSLGQIRQMAQQKSDRVGSNFVTLPEWNTYITQSAFELYDLLVGAYGDEYFASQYSFSTTGVSQYNLPDDFYKLVGVDLGLGASTNGYTTLKRFEFIERNRYVYPQLTTTYLGDFNLKYRILGSTILFIPTPSAGQPIRLWYVPRMTQPLQDTDILDGISGWTEYVIVDAAIKALQKEESDVSVLMLEKRMLTERIESMAQSRDIGEPATISDTRRFANPWGSTSPNGDGPMGGF